MGTYEAKKKKIQDNKEKIRKLTQKLLTDSFEASMKKIEKALDSGAIDPEQWDENSNPMLLPKSILVAILLDEAKQYDGKGTAFEKQIKKESKNIGYYI